MCLGQDTYDIYLFFSRRHLMIIFGTKKKDQFFLSSSSPRNKNTIKYIYMHRMPLSIYLFTCVTDRVCSFFLLFISIPEVSSIRPLEEVVDYP